MAPRVVAQLSLVDKRVVLPAAAAEMMAYQPGGELRRRRSSAMGRFETPVAGLGLRISLANPGTRRAARPLTVSPSTLPLRW